MKYSIEDTTLTGIADALRRKLGETKAITVTETQQFPVVTVVKTPNATGFDTWEGSYSDYDAWDQTFVESGGNALLKFTVVHIPTATSIKVKYRYGLSTTAPLDTFQIGKGELTSKEAFISIGFQNTTSEHCLSSDPGEYTEYTFENTDTITFKLMVYEENVGKYNNLGYYAEVWGLDADGNPLETYAEEVEIDKEIPNVFSSSDMATAIDEIEAIPTSALEISGNCNYRFLNDGWNWFIEKYGDKITTKDINACIGMFSNCTLTEIPFEINCYSSDIVLSNMFDSCRYLQTIPKINNCKPRDMQNIFKYCSRLRELPEDIENWFNWSWIESQNGSYNGNRSGQFDCCYSLRNIPMGFLNHLNRYATYSYTPHYGGFKECYALNEINGLPFCDLGTWTSNSFMNSFTQCSRISKLILATQDDLTPYKVSWKSQTIDLTGSVGYASNKTNILNYNSGITADKEVTDDVTYQALKDDPDWFTTNVAYSRYNHDSAVETINSLPDTSEYLATAGGTNTIKFKGAAGSATTGGAINTLTEEEIAVATAKGWTVTFA